MPEHIEILKKLVSFPTVNNPVEGKIPDQSILNYIADYLQDFGYSIVRYENNGYGSLIAYIKRGAPKILFIGHCDVVPPGPNWKTDPFKLTIIESKGFARGAADMKGADAVMLSLAKTFAEKGQATIVYVFNMDEESGGSYGAGKVLDKLNELSLVPDYVINGDANGLQVINRRRNPYIITLKIPKLKKKIKAKIKEKTFQTEIAGNRTMHAAYYDKNIDTHCGVKASKELSENNYYVTSIEGPFVKNNVIPSHIKLQYLIPSDDGELLEYDQNLTQFIYSIKDFDKVDIPSDYSSYGINLTFNYYKEKEDHHLIQLDLRIMSNDHSFIQKYFEKFFSDHNVSAEVISEGSIGPVNTPEDSVLVTKSLLVSSSLGLSNKPIEMGGATDSRWFSAENIPAIEFGPIGGNVHGSNEFVELETLKTARDFYEKLFFSLSP